MARIKKKDVWVMKDENDFVQRILNNVGKVIFGKEKEITDILKGMIAGGHILIEDVPGVGKTTLVKAIAKSINLTFRRIQFTPDLLPSDISGISIYNQKTMEFEFRKGPVFSNIVLADEINRTSPKTQSALLEVMEERQVSDGNNTYKIEKPFFVLATQNPIEHEGTYNLPEAELDRFMMKVSIGYPDVKDEARILKVYRDSTPLDDIKSVGSPKDILQVQNMVREVYVSDEINEYIARIAKMTRESGIFALGASTRACISLLKVSQAQAYINGRSYVVPDDVKNNAELVLSHRLVISDINSYSNYTSGELLRNMINKIQVPKVKEYA